MIVAVVLLGVILIGLVLLWRKHRKDSVERRKHELAVLPKAFMPPVTKDRQVVRFQIFLLLSAWMLKKNSIESTEKEEFIVSFLNEKFKVYTVEVLTELQVFKQQSIHIRSVANWIISELPSREDRTLLIDYLIDLIYTSGSDIIDREFTALVRLGELIGVHAEYIEKVILRKRKALLGDEAGEERWHRFTDRGVRRRLALAVLGLLGDASEQEIKKQYRELVKENHPDRIQDLTEDEKKQRLNKFLEIQDAYEELMEGR